MSRPVVLLVPGIEDARTDHWQNRWEQERVDCQRIDQDIDDPDPLSWLKRIDDAVERAAGPVLLVAHSMGCLAVAAWALLGKPSNMSQVEALLVAPCDPNSTKAPPSIRRFGCFAFNKLPIPTTVIASSNDPFSTLGRGYAIARTWGSQVIEAGELGHIDAHAGVGSWPWGQAVVDRIVDRLAQRVPAAA